MTRVAALPAAFAVSALMAAAATPASAQQASYCGGALRANAFYSNVFPAAAGAQVEYHALLQNVDPSRRTLVATMLEVQRVGNLAVIRPLRQLELGPYEQKDTVVLSVQTANRAGAGAPTPMQVGQSVRFTCVFR